MLYFFDPIDQFFFRSAVPFEAGGESTTIASRFPPLPTVYAGAMRPYTAPTANKHALKIGFNGLWLDDGPYFPLPLDVHLTEQENGLTAKPLTLRKTPATSFPLPYLPCFETTADEPKSKKVHNAYLSQSQLQSYLTHKDSCWPALDINEDYVHTEAKLGIAIDPQSGTAQDERIYQINTVRPVNGLRLAADITGIADAPSVVYLGGEGKLAAVDKAQDLPLSFQAAQAPTSDSRYFKLYFATPAIFKNGWLPSWIDPDNFTGRFGYKKHTISVKLLSACIGRKILCGGFGCDGTDGRYKPREMRYAIPAGSVYYFEITDKRDSFIDAVRLFHQKCLSDYREGLGFDYQVFDRSRYCDRGFGYALVGQLTKEQEDVLNESH